MSGRRAWGRELIVGRLLAYGRAPYKFQPQQSESYYLKLLTDRGTRLVWGKDLARALAASKTQPKVGDRVGARRVAREPITLPASRQKENHPATSGEPAKYLNRWEVEKAAYFVERAQLARRVRDERSDARRAVRSHPELLSTYLTLRGAQEIAERRIDDPKDRERFVALVREAMASSVNNGEPMPPVRLHEPAKKPTAPASQASGRKRDDEPTR